ncbi:hypothetical protein Scep_009096 [Stephania cephalantha]|uniref:RanBP2-type domain-containing protein n=1 Tax=Stephania cephalantha TaxID=152367 RepID=A0AAP0JTF9_9MAGN
MAFTPLSLLLRNPNFHSRITLPIHSRNLGFIRFFSTSQSSSLPNLSDSGKPSLSARLSFVFDQIDAMDRDRTDKDEALQRIRSWRESKKKSKIEDEKSSESVDSQSEEPRKFDLEAKKEVEFVHPWPEWIELMERLVNQNYFDHRRSDEDKVMRDLSIDVAGMGEELGFDFTRDWNTVRTAVLNFGRDRFDILKSLSRHDIQIMVGYGCPSTDKKVVFSAKMLRKHVHLDEGDVCSSCSLRSSCEKAYLLSRKEDEARTLDVVRVLLTFGFDPINDSVENKSLLKHKSVKTVIRKLLHEVVKLSAVPIDPNLPPPVIKKAPPKVKQPPPPPKKRVGRDDIEMKKGDWLCPKCDFMNFAKNTVCLQCDAKRPKRQLLPGEWECPKCNFLNYRRNMACFHCDHQRPPGEFVENHPQPRPRAPKTRLEKVADMSGVSNAWNFDFDDNESDGADVAAFEYADPPKFADENFMENHNQTESMKGFEGSSFETNQLRGANGRSRHPRSSETGFDDFDDEEDDDINSYEIDTSRDNSIQNSSLKDFSEVEGFSESDDLDSSDLHLDVRRGNTSSHGKLSRPRPGRPNFSGTRSRGQDFESDEELSTYPNWRPSDKAASRFGTSSRSAGGRHLDASDDEFESNSDSNDSGNRDFGHRQRSGDKRSSNASTYRRGASNNDLHFESESNNDDDEDDLPSRRNSMRGRRVSFSRRGSDFVGHDRLESARDSQFRSNGRFKNRKNSFDNTDLDGYSHRYDRGDRKDSYNRMPMDKRRGNTHQDRYSGMSMDKRRGNSRHDSYNGMPMDKRRSNTRQFGRREDFGPQVRGRLDTFHDQSDSQRRDNRRRIIER